MPACVYVGLDWLLDDVEEPSGSDLESLCLLLNTVGKSLDTADSKAGSSAAAPPTSSTPTPPSAPRTPSSRSAFRSQLLSPEKLEETQRRSLDSYFEKMQILAKVCLS